MNLANLPILQRLRPFFTPRFIKFGLVGASGVVVNLGVLWLGMRLGMRSTAASALAIQISILSNFAVNELWTFAELRPGSRLGRVVRFQLVSLVGAAVQFGVFVGANLAALRWQGGSGNLQAYFDRAPPGLIGWLQHPVIDPPDVGTWVYVSQLVGIGVATAWNFLANIKWTWGERG